MTADKPPSDDAVSDTSLEPYDVAENTDYPSVLDYEKEKPIEESNGNGMTFLEHLEDMRATIMHCSIAYIAGITLVGMFLTQISQILIYPLRWGIGENTGRVQGLITTSPMGVFSVMIQICLLGGLFLALPFMLYFIAKFVAPALSDKEKKALIPACVASFILFTLGSALSYFLLVPASLQIAKYYNDMLGFETIWNADSYYGLLVWMVVGVGATFQFPLLVIGAVKMHFVSVTQLKKNRPYSVGVFLLLSAFITPTTDPFTFLLMAIPMVIFYEIAIIYCAKMLKKKQQEF